MSLTLYADDSDYTIMVQPYDNSTTVLKPGDSVKLKITIKQSASSNGISAYNIYIKFDTDKFILVDNTDGANNIGSLVPRATSETEESEKTGFSGTAILNATVNKDYNNVFFGATNTYSCELGEFDIGYFTLQVADNITPNEYEITIPTDEYNTSYFYELNDSNTESIENPNITPVTVTVLPSITDIEITNDPTDKVNGYVKSVTAKIKTNIAAGSELLDTIVYSFDGGTSWQCGDSKTYTENYAAGITKVCIGFDSTEDRDTAPEPDSGSTPIEYNLTDAITINYIDNTAPAVSGSVTVPDDAAYGMTNKLTVSASDEESGLDTNAYQYLLLADDTEAQSAINAYLNPVTSPSDSAAIDPNTLPTELDDNKWVSDTEYDFNANTATGKKVYAFVRDKLQNISFMGFEISKIDATKPSIDTVTLARIDFGAGEGLIIPSENGWKVNVTASDNQSGVKRIGCIDAADVTESDGVLTYDTADITWSENNYNAAGVNALTFTENGNYYITAEDNAGNIALSANKTTIDYIIDGNMKRFIIETANGDLGKDITVTVTTANIGLFVTNDTLTIGYDTELTYKGSVTGVENSNSTLTVDLTTADFPLSLTFTTPATSLKDTFTIDFTSDTDNKQYINNNWYYLTDGEITLKDLTGPKITVSAIDNTTAVSSYDVTYSFEDRSGFPEAYVSYGDEAYITPAVSVGFAGGTIKSVADTGDYTKKEFTVTYTELVYISGSEIKAKDASPDKEGGNIGECGTVIKIDCVDTVGPTISVALSPASAYGQTVTLTVIAKDKGLLGGLVAGLHETAYKFTLVDTPAEAEAQLAAWRANAGEPEYNEPEVPYPGDPAELTDVWQTQSNEAFNKNTVTGKCVCYAVRDKLENISVGYIPILTVDTDNPIITFTPSTTDWTNEDVILTVVANDAAATPTNAMSGIKSVKVYNTADAVTLLLNETAAGTYTVQVAANGTYKLEVTDNAGNVKELECTVENIDKDKPTVTTDYNSINNNTMPRHTDFPVMPAFTDNAAGTQSGIALGVNERQLYYIINSKTAPASAPDKTAFIELGEDGKITISENGAYYLYTIDKAGNISDHVSFIVNNIDKAAPTFTLNYSPSLETATNGDVSITVTAADTQTIGFNSNLSTTISYSFNGGVTWNNTSDANVLEVSENKTIAADTIQIKDAAGNVVKYGSAIVIKSIDKIKPIATNPTFSTTEPTNSDITVTINATDTQSAGYTLGKGLEYKLSTENDYKDSNQFTVSANGDYTYSVKDAAGNEVTGTFSVHNIDKEYPTFNDTNNALVKAVFDPASRTKDDVKITVTARDRTSDGYVNANNKLQYSFDSGKTWQDDNFITISQNKILKTNANAPSLSQIKVRDSAGNVDVYTEDVVVDFIDKDAPKLLNADGEREDEENGYVQFTPDENGTIHYAFSENMLTDKTALTSTDTLVKDTQKKYETTITEDEYYLCYYTVDDLRNESDVLYIEIPKFNDTSSPVISEVKVKRTSASSVEITFESDERGTLYYKVTSFALFKSTLKNTFTMAKTSKTEAVNTLEITGITSSSTRLYYYAVDRNGNSTSMKSVTIPQADSTAPTVTASAERPNSENAYIEIKTNENAKIYYIVADSKVTDKSRFTLANTNYITEFSTIADMSDFYGKTLSFYAEDEMHNASSIQTIVIPAYDETPMQIDDFKLTRSGSKVTISFTANEAGTFRYAARRCLWSFNTPEKDDATSTFEFVKGENSFTISVSSISRLLSLIYSNKLTWYATDVYGNEYPVSTINIPN